MYRHQLIDGLRQFPLLYADTRLQTVMSHAGLFPQWSLEQGQAASDAVSAQLRGGGYRDFLREIFGNLPNQWSPELRGMDYWRFAVNAFCRMRYLNEDGSLNLEAKDKPKKTKGLQPWFSVTQTCGWRQLSTSSTKARSTRALPTKAALPPTSMPCRYGW